MIQDRPVLLIIRGNSGSGKTTLAAALQRAWGPGTANIGQDHLRRTVLREHDVPHGDNIGLIDHTVRHCLGIGYNVILEGILVTDHYAPMLRRLVADHDGRVFVVYLDVPLDETLRRHEARALRTEVEPDRLRAWFVPDDHLGVPGEVVINTGSLTLGETTDRLLQLIGHVEARPEQPGTRFL